MDELEVDDSAERLPDAAPGRTTQFLRGSVTDCRCRPRARDPSTLVNWGSAERRELRAVAQEVWLEWSEKSEMAKRVFDSHIAFMTSMGLL